MTTQRAAASRAAQAGVAAATCLVGLAAVRLTRPASTPGIRLRGTDWSPVIAALEHIRIGGSDQWVLERSENVTNPIVLYVHGGPGTSQLTSNRRDTRQLERFFTVVNWDQRGAGKSYAAIRDARRMTIDQFVADTRDVTSHLLTKFGQDRMVLVGHSWGTVIGALAVSRFPELYSCYVGIGQVGNMEHGEKASYQWTLEQAKERGNRRAARALAAMGPPPYRGDWQKNTVRQRMYLARFGGEVYRNSHGASGLVLAGVLFSPEYTLTDRLNYFRGITGSMRLLWPELLSVDLAVTVSELKVPVFFLEGRHDHESPSAVAARYFEALRAPSKELIWFEKSAHLPNSEERDIFTTVMVEKVLPIATGAS